MENGCDTRADGRPTEGTADHVETFFRGRWNQATPAERRLLAVVVETGTDEIKRSDLAHLVDVRTTDLRVSPASPLGKGILSVPAAAGRRRTVPTSGTPSSTKTPG